MAIVRGVLALFLVATPLASYAQDCRVSVRLIEADPPSAEVSEGVEEEEQKQLSGLAYGRYQVMAKGKFHTHLGEKGSLELKDGRDGLFQIEVTPHAIADEKVHYTLEWKRSPEESIVATKVGVENGRSVMVGGSMPCPKKKQRSVVVGVNVKCKTS